MLSLRKKIQGSCKLVGHTLEQVVPSNPYLGVQIQEDLKWKEHINNVTKKIQFHLRLHKKEFTTLSERM
jgi:hypothetical protein